MKTIGRAPADQMFLQGQRILLHTQTQVTEQSTTSSSTFGAAYVPLSAIPDHMKLQLYCRGAIYSRDGTGTATLRTRFGSLATAAVTTTANAYTPLETVVTVVGPQADTVYFELVGDAATAFASSATIGLYLEVT